MTTVKKYFYDVLVALALAAAYPTLGCGPAFAQTEATLRLQDALQVSALSLDNRNPAIAFSPDGKHLFVAWDGLVGSNRRILLRERIEGEWLPTVVLDANPAGENRFPSIAIDENGTPQVVWISNLSGKRQPVYARRLSRFPNSWFQQAVPFPKDSTTVGNCDYVNLQLDGEGRPYIVWQYGFGNIYSVVCSSFNIAGDIVSSELSPGASTHNLYPELFFLPEPTVYWYMAQSDQFYLIGSRLQKESGEWQVSLPENLEDLPADNLPDLFQTGSGPLAAIWYDRQFTETGVASDRIFVGVQNSETRGRGAVIDKQPGAENNSVTGTTSDDAFITAWISESYEGGADVFLGIGDSPDKLTVKLMSDEAQDINSNPKVAGKASQVAVAWEEQAGNGAQSSQVIIRVAELK